MSPTLSDSRQLPATNNDDAPPPYMSPAISPASPTMVHSPGRSKGSSFFRALTSSLRSKPDPLVSALCQAVVQGNEQQISGLISQGANINGSNENGRTPLKCAIKSDQARAARLLLSAGVKTSSKGWSEQPPLFQAASAGSLNVAQVLLEFGADVHSKAASGQSYLVDVVNKGNVAGVGFLLASGAAADTKDITGQQIIVTAVKKGSVELVRLLIDNGADINTTDIVGNPLLAIAVEKGDINMLELLLDKGVIVDARTHLGTTILEQAIGKRKFDIAKKLLVRGANPGGTDIHSQPILIKILRDALLKTEDKVEVIRLLLDNGVDPDTVDAIWGLPAICHAVEMSKTPVVEEMLRRGAKTKVRMLAGQTLLTYSIDVNRRNHIKALLDYGADVNEVDGLNRTPLMLALLRLDYNLAKMFVDHGADATAKANEDAVKFIKGIKRNDFLELFQLAASAESESARPERNTPIVPHYATEMPASEVPPSYELAAGKW
jgi:ankyrin repeat protein